VVRGHHVVIDGRAEIWAVDEGNEAEVVSRRCRGGRTAEASFGLALGLRPGVEERQLAGG
jgi:hypothetical protein